MSTAEMTTETAAPATEPSPEQKQLDRVRALYGKVLAKRLDFEHKDGLRKKAKEAWDVAQDALNEYVAGLSEELPLFDGQTRDGAPTGVVSDPERGEGAWRDVPVIVLSEVYGLGRGVAETLAEADLTTIGKLADWSNDGSVLNDIPGIGRAKAEAVEQALDRFWEANKAALEAIDAAREEEVTEAVNGEPEPVPDSDPDAEPVNDLGIYPPEQLGTPSPLLRTEEWADAGAKPKRGKRK